MASVVFSTDFFKEKEITEFYAKIVEAKEGASRRGVGNEDRSGFWVGELLKSPAGALKEEFSFSLQAWDQFASNLKDFARDLNSRYGFDGLWVLGLD